MGRPVVASPEAAEGIDALDGRDLIVAATPDREAAGCPVPDRGPGPRGCLGLDEVIAIGDKVLCSAPLLSI